MSIVNYLSASLPVYTMNLIREGAVVRMPMSWCVGSTAKLIAQPVDAEPADSYAGERFEELQLTASARELGEQRACRVGFLCW